MRTVEEIIIQLDISSPEGQMFTKYRDKPTLTLEEVIRVVYAARKEAIEECAAKARVDWVNIDEVDKQSILSLINEIK